MMPQTQDFSLYSAEDANSDPPSTERSPAPLQRSPRLSDISAVFNNLQSNSRILNGFSSSRGSQNPTQGEDLNRSLEAQHNMLREAVLDRLISIRESIQHYRVDSNRPRNRLHRDVGGGSASQNHLHTTPSQLRRNRYLNQGFSNTTSERRRPSGSMANFFARQMSLSGGLNFQSPVRRRNREESGQRSTSELNVEDSRTARNLTED